MSLPVFEQDLDKGLKGVLQEFFSDMICPFGINDFCVWGFNLKESSLREFKARQDRIYWCTTISRIYKVGAYLSNRSAQHVVAGVAKVALANVLMLSPSRSGSQDLKLVGYHQLVNGKVAPQCLENVQSFWCLTNHLSKVRLK
jgi:hypothetical protein